MADMAGEAGGGDPEFLRSFSPDNASHIPPPGKAAARQPCFILKPLPQVLEITEFLVGGSGQARSDKRSLPFQVNPGQGGLGLRSGSWGGGEGVLSSSVWGVAVAMFGGPIFGGLVLKSPLVVSFPGPIT